MDRMVRRRAWVHFACVRSGAIIAAALLPSLATAETGPALRQELEQHLLETIQQLARKDGFMLNEKVRIPLPGFLDDASRMLKSTGYGRALEELILALNRTAEIGLGLVAKEVRASWRAAIAVERTGSSGVVYHWQQQGLMRLMLPTQLAMESAAKRTALKARYQVVVERMAQLGLMGVGDPLDLHRYIAEQTLQGLFATMQDAEVRWADARPPKTPSRAR